MPNTQSFFKFPILQRPSVQHSERCTVCFNTIVFCVSLLYGIAICYKRSHLPALIKMKLWRLAIKHKAASDFESVEWEGQSDSLWWNRTEKWAALPLLVSKSWPCASLSELLDSLACFLSGSWCCKDAKWQNFHHSSPTKHAYREESKAGERQHIG